MNSNSFNMRRMAALLGIDLSERKRTLLLQCVMLLGLLIVAAVYSAFQFNRYYYQTWEMDPALRSLPIFYTIVVFIGGCLSASFVFNDLATKEGRLRSLMRPALDVEKFITRWVIYVPGFIVMFIAGVFIAESLRTGIVMLRFSDVTATPCYALIYDSAVRDWLFEGVTNVDRFICNFSLFFLAIQSFFVLGSAVWPKNSALKTFATFFCLTVAMALLTTWSFDLFSSEITFCHKSDFFRENSDRIATVLMIAAITTNYVLAWLRLGETDVITTRR